jgi:pyrophosphatase PpaX
VLLAIFTGKGRPTTSITLEVLGLTGLFDLVVTGNDVEHHKPHPEGIFRVLERFDLAPENVLMVGDSLTDLRASRAAGVRIATVLWDSFDHSRVLAEGPDLVFRTVESMAEWIRNQLNGRDDPPGRSSRHHH